MIDYQTISNSHDTCPAHKDTSKKLNVIQIGVVVANVVFSHGIIIFDAYLQQNIYVHCLQTCSLQAIMLAHMTQAADTQANRRSSRKLVKYEEHAYNKYLFCCHSDTSETKGSRLVNM